MINNQKQNIPSDDSHSEVVETHVFTMMYELHKALGCADRVIKQSVELRNWILENKHRL